MRIIARLDIKGPNVIKGIRLEGLRVVGDPNALALKYYDGCADELLFMDSVASLYRRNNLTEIIKRAARDVFIPITVGGGVRSVEDAIRLLNSGADKVAVNTAAIERPELIRELAERLGSQCVVLSIEAKRNGPGWEPYTNCGRVPTGLDAVLWAQHGESLGAGEILITSVDREGTRQGMDLELLREVREAVSIPVIASGGVGTPGHVAEAAPHCDAVAIADAFHYDRFNVFEARP